MLKLVCISGMNQDEEFLLHDGENTIGRNNSNDICVLDKKSSRKHCKLILDGEKITLVDLNSTNGVRVNNTFITEEEEISIGDHIRIGQTVFVICDKNSNYISKELTETEKIRKQKKYNNLLQKTSFQTTQTSNLQKVKAKPDENETGFIAYFNKNKE